MKNKDKKKAGAKKEIKRPTHKKPRPKKYVEAKIPQLPPVPTEQIPITKDTPPVITVELPENTTEERLNELLKIAVEEVKKAGEAYKINALQRYQLKYIFGVDPMTEEERKVAHEKAIAAMRFKVGKRPYEVNKPKTVVVAPVPVKQKNWFGRLLSFFGK